MKKVLAILTLPLAITACSNPSNSNDHDHEHEDGDTSHVHEMSMEEEAGAEGNEVHFGEKIDEAGAISVEELTAQMEGKSELATKVKGEVTEVCQKKGCWMKLQQADGKDIMITFKDYGFFVPKNLGGETIVMEGKALYDTLDVETLRHYAEDAGKTEDEIAEITEPEIKLAFEATGVKILK